MGQLSRNLAFSVLLACSPGFIQKAGCQAKDELTARTLYYNSGSDAEPKQPAAKPGKRTAASKPQASVPEPATPPATNLGVRYNLLLVDDDNNSRPVNPNMMFRNNDCVALSIQSNYDGYLYVLNRGSSGKWDFLLPSMDLAEESNHIQARKDARAPEQACFRLDDPPGVEHLYVVLSRSPQDVSQLNAAVTASRGPGTALRASEGVDSAATPPPSLDTQMARLQEGMRSRDLRITKVGKPTMAGEPANAVYVVDTSHGASDRIVTEIQIRHN